MVHAARLLCLALFPAENPEVFETRAEGLGRKKAELVARLAGLGEGRRRRAVMVTLREEGAAGRWMEWGDKL